MKRDIEMGTWLQPFRGALLTGAGSYHCELAQFSRDSSIGYTVPERMATVAFDLL